LKIRKIFFYILIGLSFNLSSQINPFIFENASDGLHDSDLINFNKCRLKLDKEDFIEVIPTLERISQSNPSNNYLNYLLGICYCFDIDNYEKAIPNIEKVKQDAEKIEGYHYYLGYAYQKNDSIEKAISNYEIELKKEEAKFIKRTDNIKELNFRIGQCKTNYTFKNIKNQVKIKNIGKPVNSSGAEYCPLIPCNEFAMIYTYRGDKSKGAEQILKAKKLTTSTNSELFFEDIFESRKINDTTWGKPKGINNLNTTGHDAAVSLSFDGSQLFIYKNRGAGHGDLYLSKLIGDTWTHSILQVGLNTTAWEGSACFLPNENKIIFSSERSGGYGGKDLYSAEKIKDNTWGNVKNLGPIINSKYDEDAPFVAADGRILFFSSNNSNSIGGYDVFRSDIKNGLWQKPYNLGPPINTDNDDIYFTVRADGKKGYYSTYKRGGKGEQDIYSVEPGIPGKPVALLQLEGLVTVDNKPIGAEIEIHSSIKTKKFNIRLNSNKQSGKFLCNLPAGDNYEIRINVEKFPPQIIDIKTQGIDSFLVLNVYADFMTPTYDKKISELETAIKNKLNKNFDRKAFGIKYGNFAKENLSYKIQVGAFKLYENFSYNLAIGLPKIIRQTDNDGITRFTMGNYKTYNEALALLEIIQKSKIKDAFIIAIYNGEKKQLNQLIEEKIIE
jgi:tetratricopeptide (TPR) repeat protein